jgi:hypothetical protein
LILLKWGFEDEYIAPASPLFAKRKKRARIRQISEDQTKLLFECEDDSTLDLIIVDPGNAVMVRDKNDLVEYLG